MLSIGGWTYSPSFHPVVVSPALRETFVKSSIQILENYGFDGLDIDYEYPTNDVQARGYVDLLKELRHSLDAHAHKMGTNYSYPLTVRCQKYYYLKKIGRNDNRLLRPVDHPIMKNCTLEK
jgi:chitinase